MKSKLSSLIPFIIIAAFMILVESSFMPTERFWIFHHCHFHERQFIITIML